MCAQTLSGIRLFATPWTAAHQAPLSRELSRQDNWGGLPFLPPADLPDPWIEAPSQASPALAGGFFTTAPPGEPHYTVWEILHNEDFFSQLE